MAKTMIGICDPNRDYAERFAYFIWHRMGDSYEAAAFTKPERLQTVLAAGGADILIVTEAFYRLLKPAQAGCCLRAAKTAALLTETEGKPFPGWYCLYRYRSTEQILRAVLAEHRLREVKDDAERSGKTRKIAVYSPVARCGKTSFALELSAALGQVGTVLFLSFEVLNAHLKDDADRPAVSDLLYGALIRSGREDLPVPDSERGGQVTRLGPVRCADDLALSGPEGWRGLIEALAAVGTYRFLVADLGDLVLPPASVLTVFDRIILPVLQDEVSQKKLALWEASFSEEEAAVLREKTRRLDLSFFCEPQADRTQAAAELAALAGRLVLEEL